MRFLDFQQIGKIYAANQVFLGHYS
jgi:hypothetical protein